MKDTNLTVYWYKRTSPCRLCHFNHFPLSPLSVGLGLLLRVLYNTFDLYASRIFNFLVLTLGYGSVRPYLFVFLQRSH